MKKFWHLSIGILLFFLLVFALAEAAGIGFDSMLTDHSQFSGFFGIFLSITLLVADLFLPVPSSLIMIGNGAIYGPFFGGLVSLAGGLGAVLIGYYLGHSGENVALRWIDRTELDSARRFFERYGILAVAISRPIPLLAETIAVLAGLSGWGVRKTLLSAVIGLLPVVFIYAYSGAFAAQNDYGVLSFLLVIGLSSVGWLVGRRYFAPKHPEKVSVVKASSPE
jgi:uncharacterized membrane protein YdjX (TVP38/TMEM64 family)